MDSLYKHEEVLDFEDHRFYNKVSKINDDSVVIKCNVTSNEDFLYWKDTFSMNTNHNFNVVKMSTSGGMFGDASLLQIHPRISKQRHEED
ncbi:hypothetical protein Pmani_002235 [Petrolisthes manimaculis]|uniref:Uncharacterized protein n=1 Tax=Petrolisthes manimaculis TaxID=1843537 RepID=A0AAE1QI02_9EUCA|nr:hypothetical protein Pmani_002235 [Petrolisthes manimaculis]